MINSEREYIKIDNYKKPDENEKLLWFLREYLDSSYFITNLMRLESELFRMNENDREKTLLNRVTRIVKDKENKVGEYYKLKIEKYEDIKIVKEHMKVIKHIHNNINNRKYMIIVQTCKSI